MDAEDGLTLRPAVHADRDTVLGLPTTRWQETDTLSVEFSHIIQDANKEGYVQLTADNIVSGFIAVYIGNRGRDLLLLHCRISGGGFRHEVLKNLLAFAVHDITGQGDSSLQRLVLTAAEESYAIIKNSILSRCQPLFVRNSLLLRGNMSYVLNQMSKWSSPSNDLMFLEGIAAFGRLLSQSSYRQGFAGRKLTVRGDPLSLSDFLDDLLPFQGMRALMTFTRRPGQLGGISVGTVKEDTTNRSKVLHIDMHTSHWGTLEAHVIEHLTRWASDPSRYANFYLEINYNEDIALWRLLTLAGKLGLMPRDECSVKTLISLEGLISDIPLGL